ncbi:hypothetical protein DPMN_000305 [Dreissena polymorpha]|uniref:Plexin TIG domain-containing protein n=1 Tax=Dreissena polymorpha TaxID=45954 RepID=A0A9D4MJD3_DREPO|nr:hypothetical protein DPMN_000305 [Dreissena polymorpha]
MKAVLYFADDAECTPMCEDSSPQNVLLTKQCFAQDIFQTPRGHKGWDREGNFLHTLIYVWLQVVPSPACPDQTTAAVRSPTTSYNTDGSISVRVADIQPDQMDNVLCLFTYSLEVKYSTWKITSSNLEFEALQFEFSDVTLPIVTAQFTVTSGKNSVPLDNPKNIKVRIYKCGTMTFCPASDWLDRSTVCPNPQILGVRVAMMQEMMPMIHH